MHHAPLKALLSCFLLALLLSSEAASQTNPLCDEFTIPNTKFCLNWQYDSITTQMSVVLPGCPGSPQCMVTVWYYQRTCYLLNTGFECQIYVDKIEYDADCIGCPAGDLVRGLLRKLVTEWNDCTSSDTCFRIGSLYLAGCVQPIYDAQRHIIQIAASGCEEQVGCCGAAYDVCPDGFGGYTVTTTMLPAYGDVCPESGPIIDITPFFGQCIALCSYLDLDDQPRPQGAIGAR